MRGWTAARALAARGFLAAGPAGGESLAQESTLAAVLLVEEGAPLEREAAAALRDALLAPGRRTFVVSEISVAADGYAVRDAVGEARRLGPQVAVALGPRIADDVAQTLRGVPVLRVVAGSRTTPLGRSPDVSGAWLGEGGLASELRRIVPGAQRLGWIGTPPDPGASRGVELRPFAPTGDDAPARARSVREALAHEVDALWLAEDVPPDDAAALADAFAGTGLPLLGTLRAHLDRGAAVVVRCDPRDVGALAAAAAAQLAATADPGAVTVRRVPARRLREVHLGNARRLGFPVPMTLLAAADLLVPRVIPPGEVRR